VGSERCGVGLGIANDGGITRVTEVKKNERKYFLVSMSVSVRRSVCNCVSVCCVYLSFSVSVPVSAFCKSFFIYPCFFCR
jgi:hypothetical protein